VRPWEKPLPKSSLLPHVFARNPCIDIPFRITTPSPIPFRTTTPLSSNWALISLDPQTLVSLLSTSLLGSPTPALPNTLLRLQLYPRANPTLPVFDLLSIQTSTRSSNSSSFPLGNTYLFILPIVTLKSSSAFIAPVFIALAIIAYQV
jgi:hypothetical protein